MHLQKKIFFKSAYERILKIPKKNTLGENRACSEESSEELGEEDNAEKVEMEASWSKSRVCEILNVYESADVQKSLEVQVERYGTAGDY